MATTGLFVEIIVIGVLAEVWIATFFLAFLEVSQRQSLVGLFAGMKDLAPITAVVLLALTYAVGWIVNFASAEFFNHFFSGKFRDQLFGGKDKWEESRALVFQNGSSEAIEDLLLDRHVIRIARSNVVNFSLSGLALICYGGCGREHTYLTHRVLAIVVFTSFGLASLSGWQWRKRYEGIYGRLKDVADAIRRDQPAPPPVRDSTK